MRAGLTVLGILIGVTAVVTVTALSQGASKMVSGQIEAIGTNVLFVFPQPTQVSGARAAKATGRLTEGDARAVVRDSVSVGATAPYLETATQIVYGDKNVSTAVIGTTLAYFPIRTFK